MMRALLLALVAAAGCAKSSSHAEPKSSPGKAASVSQSETAAASIGSATMRADGTIVLQLRATDGTGMRGDARLTYPPDHPQYQKILAHLGGLRPGEEKPVPPWPE